MKENNVRNPFSVATKFKRSLCIFILILFGMKKKNVMGVSCIGKKQFLLTLQESLLQLKELDASMLEVFKKSFWIVFQSLGAPVLSKKTRLFGIDEQWLKWGSEGLLANIVFAQNTLSFEIISASHLNEARKCALEKTTKWLEEKMLSKPIIQQFRKEMDQMRS